MEPPKIIREADPGEDRGCWMGCFGIGCLVIVVAFFGLIVGGYYGVMHTSLPLVLIEQALEEDGKVKVEGLSGSISKGVHIDELKFLTVDDEHWSELRGVAFDYNGFFDMSRSGRFIVERMSVESGKIYADIEGPDDFLFSPGDLGSFDEFEDSDLTEMRVDLLEVKNLQIINLDTDYSIDIEHASLKDFIAKGEDGIVHFGDLTIRSNMVEADAVACPRWPESENARRIAGTVRAQLSNRLKQDVDFAIDFDFQPGATRQAISMFGDTWVQEFSKRQRSLQLTDFNPADYFTSQQILPGHFQLHANRQLGDSRAEEVDAVDEESPTDEPNRSPWEISPGASFQLGATTFQIKSAEGNRAPLQSIVGTADIGGETVTAELRCRDYFQRGRIILTVGDHPADREDWARVVFDRDFASLDRADQRLLEATIATASRDSGQAEKESSESEQDSESTPPAEAEDPSLPPAANESGGDTEDDPPDDDSPAGTAAPAIQ
jgi:hypothetical protein